MSGSSASAGTPLVLLPDGLSCSHLGVACTHVLSILAASQNLLGGRYRKKAGLGTQTPEVDPAREEDVNGMIAGALKAASELCERTVRLSLHPCDPRRLICMYNALLCVWWQGFLQRRCSGSGMRRTTSRSSRAAGCRQRRGSGAAPSR